MLGLALVLIAPAIASAATLKVSENGNDVGTCAVTPCETIGYAVGLAAAGDTVQVEQGSYEVEATIVVDKAVSILGAQAGVDARGRNLPDGEETVITWNSAAPPGSLPIVRLSGRGATVDGVTISGHSQAAIQTMNSSSGYAVRNSILAGNRLGVDLETTAVDPALTTVEQNRFEAAENGRQEVGIYGDHTASDVTIRANSFVNHSNVPINISGDETRVQEDLLIEGNSFENERHLILWTADGVRISGNTFANGQAHAQAIAVQGGVENLEISGNSIVNVADAGVLFSDYYGSGPNGSTVISGNTIIGTNSSELEDAAAIAITSRTTGGPGTTGDAGYEGTLTVTGNRIVGNGLAGLRNDVADTGVNARNNWWGCNAGPGALGCDTVAVSAGSVVSTPHLVLTTVAVPGSVWVGGAATVTAALNSNGASQSVAGAPDGTPVSLGATHGSITPAAATLQGGAAQAVFTAGGLAGTATVSAAVDNEQVVLQIPVVEPQTPPAPKPAPPPADEAVEPPAPSEVRDRASRVLGNPAVNVRPVLGLASLRVLVPRRGAGHRTVKPRIPVVTGSRVRIHSGAIGRRIPQRLAALGSFRGAHRAVVTQTVRIGRRTVKLPRQRFGVGEGGAKVVRLPITKAMRRVLLRGRSVVLTLRVTAVDESGERRTTAKRFRITGEKPRNRGKHAGRGA